jgi:hypothetical protein
MKKIKIRVGDIEFTNSKVTVQGEFSKWYENDDYNKLEEYLKEGWVDDGDSVRNESKRLTISKSCFKNPECRYVVAFMKYNPKEEDFHIESVGDRLLKVNMEDFMEVYEIADKKMKRLIKNEEE